MYKFSKKLATKILDKEITSQLYDDICDMFAVNGDTLKAQPKENEINDRFWRIRNLSKPQSPIRQLCDAIISATPHSLMVERVVSHYNLFRY